MTWIFKVNLQVNVKKDCKINRNATPLQQKKLNLTHNYILIDASNMHAIQYSKVYPIINKYNMLHNLKHIFKLSFCFTTGIILKS